MTIPVSKFDLYYVRFKNIRIGQREMKGRGDLLRSIILYEIEIACTDHYIRGKPVPPRGAYTSWTSSKQRAAILKQPCGEFVLYRMAKTLVRNRNSEPALLNKLLSTFLTHTLSTLTNSYQLKLFLAKYIPA